jgi:hypothetical protein
VAPPIVAVVQRYVMQDEAGWWHRRHRHGRIVEDVL